MNRRKFLGYAGASAVALVVPWNGLRPVYVHEKHIAFIVRRHWKSGEHVMAENVLWPHAVPGGLIKCGTCDFQFIRIGPWNLTAAFA
jgi:hypothetical protein